MVDFLGVQHCDNHWFVKVFGARFPCFLSLNPQHSAQLYGNGISISTTSNQLGKWPNPRSLPSNSNSCRKIV